MIEKLVSGGQTGVDQAALDWAIEHEIPHGGWCPKNRIAENGTVPERYQLVETPKTAFRQRTEWNVRDSDGTALLTTEAELKTGTLHTSGFANRLAKPWIHVYPHLTPVSKKHDDWQPEAILAGKALRHFVETHNIRTLNVAGPRESNDPAARLWTELVLTAAFAT